MKIGITEAGDAALDMSWKDALENDAFLDGAILVTKHVTDGFIEAVLCHRNAIVHATLTGYGGSVLEPGVPPPEAQIAQIKKLIESGFDKRKLVVRIDPIIPTFEGVAKADRMYAATRDFAERYRVSIIDMYPHVRERFRKAGLPLVYGDMFSPFAWQSELVDDWIAGIEGKGVVIETCAEPMLKHGTKTGCVSETDLGLLGLDAVPCGPSGIQRKTCLCPSFKTELLQNRRRCGHGCLYCYWK
jgi:hypothetical protein